MIHHINGDINEILLNRLTEALSKEKPYEARRIGGNPEEPDPIVVFETVGGTYEIATAMIEILDIYRPLIICYDNIYSSGMHVILRTKCQVRVCDLCVGMIHGPTFSKKINIKGQPASDFYEYKERELSRDGDIMFADMKPYLTVEECERYHKHEDIYFNCDRMREMIKQRDQLHSKQRSDLKFEDLLVSQGLKKAEVKEPVFYGQISCYIQLAITQIRATFLINGKDSRQERFIKLAERLSMLHSHIPLDEKQQSIINVVGYQKDDDGKILRCVVYDSSMNYIQDYPIAEKPSNGDVPKTISETYKELVDRTVNKKDPEDNPESEDFAGLEVNHEEIKASANELNATTEYHLVLNHGDHTLLCSSETPYQCFFPTISMLKEYFVKGIEEATTTLDGQEIESILDNLFIEAFAIHKCDGKEVVRMHFNKHLRRTTSFRELIDQATAFGGPIDQRIKKAINKLNPEE